MTDDWDRRYRMNILNDFYSDKVLAGHYIFSPSGTYYQLDPDTTRHYGDIIIHKYLVNAIFISGIYEYMLYILRVYQLMTLQRYLIYMIIIIIS